MTIYNFRRLWRITILSLFKTKGTIARLTPKRLLLLAGFFVLFLAVEIPTWFCLALDRILYPDFLEVDIKSPVFIIGNPRSGTTYLHRLMALDEGHFAYIRMWEIFFAPSIVQRKLWRTLAAVDGRLGNRGHNLINKWEAELFDASVMHRIRLSMPEEDEYLMIHVGTTIIGGLVFGFPDEALPFVRFDECLSVREKSKAARFYRRCIQRHLYYHGQTRIFLSKNPFFTPKVDMLLHEFPDALIIYLIRNPLKVVPSFASLSAFWWHAFCDTEVQYPYPDFIMKTIQYWYRYPLTRLEKDPQARYVLMKFEDMVGNPRHAVAQIYDHIGLEIGPAYADILDEETVKSRHYQSRHKYSLEEIGYTRAQILCEFRDVFQRWHFDKHA